MYNYCTIMDSKSDIFFNIVIVGNADVGKSCLLLRYTNDVYDNKTQPTIGLDFKIKKIYINKSIIEARIWDTAGLERFRSITESYYKGADALLLCYDTSSLIALDQLKEWLVDNKIDINNKGEKVVKILVGTKNDTNSKQIRTEDGMDFAIRHGYHFIETSSKNGINVDETFMLAINELLKIRVINNLKLSDRSCKSCYVSIDDMDESNTNKTRCC